MNIRPSDAVIMIIALLLCWSVYRAHKDPAYRLDLFDLLMDGGRLSKTAFAFIATLGITSWIMVRLTLDGKLTEGYFTGYGLMWVAPLVAKLFSSPPPSSTTTETTERTTSVKVE